LNSLLHEQKIQFKQNNTWVMYSNYATLGLTEIKQTVLDNGTIIYHRHFTDKGREFVLQMFSKADADRTAEADRVPLLPSETL
jgi:phage antirepressor YoqD-like protein